MKCGVPLGVPGQRQRSCELPRVVAREQALQRRVIAQPQVDAVHEALKDGEFGRQRDPRHERERAGLLVRDDEAVADRGDRALRRVGVERRPLVPVEQVLRSGDVELEAAGDDRVRDAEIPEGVWMTSSASSGNPRCRTLRRSGDASLQVRPRAQRAGQPRARSLARARAQPQSRAPPPIRGRVRMASCRPPPSVEGSVSSQIRIGLCLRPMVALRPGS